MLIARPDRLFDRIFLHFLDLPFLHELFAGKTISKAARNECRLATRFAIMAADEVYVPSGSLESAVGRGILLRGFQPLFDAGIIRQLGNAPSFEAYREKSLAKYPPGSPQFDWYSRGRASSLPPFVSRNRSATLDVATAWREILDGAGLGRIVTNDSLDLPNDFENKWATIPEILGERALIVEHIAPLLQKSGLSPALRSRIIVLLTTAYFESFTRELNAGIITDLVYLKTSYQVPSHGPNLPYRALREQCERAGILPSIINADAAQLRAFRRDDIWLSALGNAVASRVVAEELIRISTSNEGTKKDEDKPHQAETKLFEAFQRLLLGSSKKIIYIEGDLVMRDKVMRDKIDVKQGIGIGGDANVHHFTQMWNESSNKIDLAQLAEQLLTLRRALKKKATTAEHDASIGAIAAAELAVRNGDGSTALQHLAGAGRWTLDVATKIGTTLASELIKKALGLP
jgi:hypothetical protein